MLGKDDIRKVNYGKAIVEFIKNFAGVCSLMLFSYIPAIMKG
jgi:hypothetical protein